MMNFLKAITFMTISAIVWICIMAFLVGPLFPASSDIPSWMLLGGLVGIAWQTVADAKHTSE